MALINLSNHPSEKWQPSQMEATKKYGNVYDLPFPQIDPHASQNEIRQLAKEYFAKCMNASRRVDAIHLMGEAGFVTSFLHIAERMGITCIHSTTERVSVEKDGVKTSVFNFVRFRQYEKYDEQDWNLQDIPELMSVSLEQFTAKRRAEKGTDTNYSFNDMLSHYTSNIHCGGELYIIQMEDGEMRAMDFYPTYNSIGEDAWGNDKIISKRQDFKRLASFKGVKVIYDSVTNESALIGIPIMNPGIYYPRKIDEFIDGHIPTDVSKYLCAIRNLISNKQKTH